MTEQPGQPHTQPSSATAERRIGVIGAGFTGSLLAVHLLRHCRTPTRVLLFDRTGRFGPGVAYRTDDRGHLLNVRAGNMSAFPDQPDHFLRWLDPLDPSAETGGAAGQAFATRGQYGRYLQDVLETARREAAALWRACHSSIACRLRCMARNCVSDWGWSKTAVWNTMAPRQPPASQG